jgi:murein DD-endopeptidase MepM/ murein hydrolase activator NlpD
MIARVGNTGISTSSHLHYEVKVNGVPQDPTTYILPETVTN